MRRAVWWCASVVATALGCSSESDPSGVGGSTGTSAQASGSSVASSSSAASSSSGGELPDTFQVTGVVTDGEAPVEGAIVLQGGGPPLATTGPDGTFRVQITTAIPGQPTLVASKVGYRTRGEELYEVPTEPVELALRFVSSPDNPAYVYGEPGVGDPALDSSTAYCGHCHTTLVAQFQTSAHASSARDPEVQDLFAGVTGAWSTEAACEQAGGAWRQGLEPGTAGTSVAKCYVGFGVLPDLNTACGAPGGLACDDPSLPAADKPTAFGACADCHAPAIDGAAGGRSLHEATGTAYEHGNHCDFCHHVRDIDLTKPPGTGGRLVLQRPNDTLSDEPGSKLVQVMFGPLLDVPNEFMGGSYQPEFATAELCAGCHEQLQDALLPGAMLDAARWPDGLPTHSTFSEWAEGPFAAADTPCQDCHMPPDDTGLFNTLDVATADNAGITFGFARPADQIRQHVFRGPLSGAPRLVDGAAALSLSSSVSGGELTVSAKLQNALAGHAIPTGEPMRALVLVVAATGCGAPLTPTGGMTISDVGGAIAEGLVDAGVVFAGSLVTWPEGAARAQVGDVVRVVRPTGTFEDYPGIGFFANPALSPAQKGLELRTPVAEASVVSIGAGALTLDATIAVQSGDLVLIGDALPALPGDGEPSKALAGSAGWVFARVLTDPTGARGVPHYRAVDMASDNRLAPMVEQTTVHAFAVPSGCTTGQVAARLLYRPLPVALARERGWDARDYHVASAVQDLAFP